MGATIRKNITVPKGIVDEVNRYDANFSGFVVDAVKEKLKALEREAFEKAMREGASDPKNRALRLKFAEESKYADAETVPDY